MSWGVSPWLYPVWDSLCLLNLIDYILFRVGEIFNYNLFKFFLITFLFLFFFWDPYNLNVDVFDLVLNVSETILSSFHSFYFTLLFRCYFHHFTSSLLIHFALDILLLIPSRVFLISVILLFVSACLSFNSSMSLLIDSCIFLHFVFKVFFFLIIFAIIILRRTTQKCGGYDGPGFEAEKSYLMPRVRATTESTRLWQHRSS